MAGALGVRRQEPRRSLELVAAAIEADFASQRHGTSAPDLEELLRKDIAKFTVAPGADVVIRPDFTPRASGQTILAWSVAAVLALLLVAVTLTRPAAPDTPTTAQALESFRQSTADLVASPFSGLGDYETDDRRSRLERQSTGGLHGAHQSPRQQSGPRSSTSSGSWIPPATRPRSMAVSSTSPPANRPPSSRSTPSSRSPSPEAFVITLEQPGGVVKSKQETVVALAKVS